MRDPENLLIILDSAPIPYHLVDVREQKVVHSPGQLEGNSRKVEAKEAAWTAEVMVLLTTEVLARRSAWGRTCIFPVMPSS